MKASPGACTQETPSMGCAIQDKVRMHFYLPILTRKGRGAVVLFRGSKIHRPVCSLLLALAVLIGCFAPVFALGSGSLSLSTLNTQAFPTLSFYLEVFDAQDQMVADLNPAQLQITEDGRSLKPALLELAPRGVQFTAAVNAAPALAAQVNGMEQLSAVRQNLMAWVGKQNAEFGDFSLAGNTGLQLIRSRDPAEWSSALDAYRPDLVRAQPGLFALTTALDLAAEQSAPERFKPAVLFITPPLNGVEPSGLGNQAARAAQMGIPVFVWLVVADPNAAQSTPIPGMSELQTLVDETGGELALVSAASPFPNLDSWLAPLRKIYRVEYLSTLQNGGEHTLSAQVQRPDLTLTARRELKFNLDVLAPNPMFVNPPQLLERSWSEASGAGEAALAPVAVDLKMLVEFPDGFERPLRVSRLYANGALVAENTAPPFDSFKWDLSTVTQSTAYILRIEVEDLIGMKGASIENPVEVSVAAPPARGLLARITPQGMVAVAAVLLAGTVLTVFLVSENRQQTRKTGRGSWRRKNDPVTQPVTIEQEPAVVRRPRRAAVPSPSWPRGAGQPVAPARMVRLAENETPIQGSQVPINRPELTFGSDPRQAVVTLSDPSVNGLHARLRHTREGGFMLEDEDSLAGTWVNYSAVAAPGRHLEHGDLIHFGRVMYRFELADAPPPVEPVIRLVDEEL